MTTAETPSRRNVWIWVSAVLLVVAVGLGIWAVSLKADLDDANQQLADTQGKLDATAQQLDSAQQAAEAQPVADESGGGKAAGLVAVGALFTGLAKELDATRDDLAATEQSLEESEQKASQAEKDAKTAEQKAADASSETDKAKAEADQANAEAEAAKARTAVAADCGKAYLSALGGLFEGDDPAAQAPAVRDDLTRITADCKDALAAGD
jgi:hypothetical protein